MAVPLRVVAGGRQRLPLHEGRRPVDKVVDLTRAGESGVLVLLVLRPHVVEGIPSMPNMARRRAGNRSSVEAGPRSEGTIPGSSGVNRAAARLCA